MKRAQVIKPTKSSTPITESDNLRVCAYCRISTDKKDQKNSLESQTRFFERYIRDNPKWNLVKVFADEGISGTSLKKRVEFKKMIDLAMRKEVQLILVKDVSRWSRNTEDSLSLVRQLRERGVFVCFINDEINTEDPMYYERLSELSDIAQRESLRTSKRVRWGQQQQLENGVVFGRKEMYGYNIKRNEYGEQYFEIIEEEAAVVRKIFNWFAEGIGTHRIVRKLLEEGIKSKYKNGWSTTVVLRLLRNEKYVGDLCQGKTFTPDPLKHNKKYNRDDSNMYLVEDHHPESAIIDRVLWNRVQEILKSRAESFEGRATYANRYWNSGKIFCGICGTRYISYTKRRSNGEQYKAWICNEAHQRGRKREITTATGEKLTVGCNAARVNNKILETAMHDILYELVKANENELRTRLLAERKKYSNPVNQDQKINRIKNNIEAKNKAIANLTINYSAGKFNDFEYTQAKKVIYAEIDELEKQLTDLLIQSTYDTRKREYDDNLELLEKIVNMSEDEINRDLYEQVINKIVVHPDKILELHLSFLTAPLFVKYETKGKGHTYAAILELVDYDLESKTYTVL